MNYKRYIRHRALIFGSMSALRAAQKITSDLEPHNVSRYGTTIYEQAYNYYQVRFKKQTLLKIVIFILLILPLPVLFYKNVAVNAALAAYYTILSYYMRKGY